MDELILFLRIGLRIFAVIMCYIKAKELNRNPWGWMLFGLVLPIIALIGIYNTKARPAKNPETDVLDDELINNS